jgi:hypothetical protein
VTASLLSLAAARRRAANLCELLAHLRERDFGRVLLEVLHHVPGHAIEYRRATLMRSEDVRPSRPPPAAISFTWASADQLPEVAALSGQRLPELQQRMARGDRCYIATDARQGGRIVHCRWVHSGSCHVRSLCYELEMEPGAAYVYGGYTERHARRRGIASNSLAGIQAELSAGRPVPLYTFSEEWNQPARLHHRRSRFSPVTRVRYAALLGLGLSSERDAAGTPVRRRLVWPGSSRLPEI